MLLGLAVIAMIWGVGGMMGAPRRMRYLLMGLAYLVIILGHLTLPDGHPLRVQTGETAAPWLLLAGFAVLVAIYRRGLTFLRGRANSAPAAADTPVFSQTELNRYARHIVLREVGGAGQKALKDAKVLVIGAGGLGAPVLQYLGAAGVGVIGVIDDDLVENANLQRQVIHKDSAIGTPKVFSAQAEIEAQNPYVTVRPYNKRLTDQIAEDLFAEYDLVLDGCDNFETRYVVNAAAARLGIPLISGALSQWEGQLAVFDPARGGPCYECIFPTAPAPELAPSCAEAGVIAPLPGVVGAMMAAEAIKLITGAGETLRQKMHIYDALYGESRTISLKNRGDCRVCGSFNQ